MSATAPITGPEQLAGVLDAAGPGLRRMIERTERRLEEVAAGHGVALAQHAASTLAAGGKRLRPMILFICAGEAEGDELVAAGAAVELLHMATLVHDDVLDRAALAAVGLVDVRWLVTAGGIIAIHSGTVEAA